MMEPLFHFALDLLKAHAPGLASIIVVAIALWAVATALARLAPIKMNISIGDRSGCVPSISAQADEDSIQSFPHPAEIGPETPSSRRRRSVPNSSRLPKR